LAGFTLIGCTSVPTDHNKVSPWQRMLQIDVEAAYQLLSADHPAMAKSLNNKKFQDNIERGRLQALERAKQVVNFEGYLATMKGLANSARDKHIWSRTSYKSTKQQWTGFIVSRHGDSYIVVEDETNGISESLKGAELMSCDRVPIKEFAENKLGGFYAVWSVEAQRIQKAPNLLIDNGNPFVLRPKVCTFSLQGTKIEQKLAWRSIKKEALRERLTAARNRGAAGFGLRSFEGGYWIALQSLNSKAGKVVSEVRDNEEQLRKAGIVVLDMRGNGGGNSQYGEEIAKVLFGNDRYTALQADQKSSCESVWRVSPGNLKQMHYYVEHFGATMPEFIKTFKPLVDLAESAYSNGEEFTGVTTCNKPVSPTKALPSITSKGEIVVVTDNTCFSSCLNVVDKFKKLGALHLGQSTDAGTHYMEVREELMPSGLSFFSTLQAMSPSSPAQYGAFEPDIFYESNIADTKLLEKWVTEAVTSHIN